MTPEFAEAMRRALDQTRASNVMQAMQTIQCALADKYTTSKTTCRDTASAQAEPHQRLIEHKAGRPDIDPIAASVLSSKPTPQRSVGEMVKRFGASRLGGEANLLTDFKALRRKRRRPPPPIPEGAQFLGHNFTTEAGSRQYKLYIPACLPEESRGMVVMLHGCMQDPDDFASGTNMNALAEAHGLLVVYPEQSHEANPSACWNWFRPNDQIRGKGEPAIIAGIARETASAFGIGREQSYIAGLSAGGAMAVIMAETYPELFAAVGVHSGLAYRSASDLPSAFAVMKGKARGDPGASARRRSHVKGFVRMVVFQGSADRKVDPSNAEKIFSAGTKQVPDGKARLERGESAGGRPYTRTIITAPDGDPALEFWLIEGAGHAWSGGQKSGSYTDPAGPDASAEMIRFFLKHSL
jgi:poly(hydroxyalkanoate) depolymerase family esterase